MAHLNEAHSILPLPQGLHNSINAIARKAEDRVYAPSDDAFYENICRGFPHPPLLRLQTTPAQQLFDNAK
jgi:hypothetical protein